MLQSDPQTPIPPPLRQVRIVATLSFFSLVCSAAWAFCLWLNNFLHYFFDWRYLAFGLPLAADTFGYHALKQALENKTLIWFAYLAFGFAIAVTLLLLFLITANAG